MKKYSIFALLALIFSFGLFTPGAHAGTVSLSGWAWSPNIGWLSFNSTDAGTGVTSGSSNAYNVYISTTTGSTVAPFGGYAWSPNIGWLSFNSADVTGCPSDGSVGAVSGCNPAIDLTTGSTTGWGRIISMENQDGGGWLQLSGTNHATNGGGGVTYNPSTGALSGMAWESSALGWISFDAASAVGKSVTVCTPGAASCPIAPSPITGICTIPATASIPQGQSTVTITPAVSGQSGGTGPYTFTPASFTLGTGYYTPSIIVKDSQSHTGSVMCNPISVTQTNPTTSLGLYIGTTPQNATLASLSIKKGNTFALAWTNTLASPYVCASSISNGGGTRATSWPSSSLASTANVSGLSTSNVSTGSYTFTMTCSGAGVTTRSAAVNLTVMNSSTIEK